TGTNRWRKFDAWPPKESKPQEFALRAGSGLGSTSETMGLGPVGINTFDEFVSDPAKPVPFINKIGIGMFQEYMTADQRFASQRPDVLVYQSPVLTEDTTISGPIEVELYVSTTGTDADWVVKLIDVYPDDYPDAEPSDEALARARPNRPAVSDVRMGGYQQLVRGEPFRGKFRNSFEKPEAFKSGEITKVKFTMPDTLHTFRPGHSIMIQVQSTWFPLVDRNPQTFCDIYSADEKDFVKQTHRVYRSPDHRSKVTLRVVK
ncbi:MAG TPA: CocE/NonD family hydrolase, partial [Gemmataceae bacterium]|nr:CocE/NonD family hydrolase [Gemmataceae bacterium]